MMTYFIDTTRTLNGAPTIHQKTVQVLMTNGTDFRRNEVAMPLAAKPDAWVTEQVDMENLWETGTPTEAGAYLAAMQRSLEEYYFNVMVAVAAQVPADGTLEEKLEAVITRGLAAIALVPEQAATFAQWQMLMGLENPATLVEKRQLIRDMFQFFLTGLLAGGIKR